MHLNCECVTVKDTRTVIVVVTALALVKVPALPTSAHGEKAKKSSDPIDLRGEHRARATLVFHSTSIY